MGVGRDGDAEAVHRMSREIILALRRQRCLLVSVTFFGLTKPINARDHGPELVFPSVRDGIYPSQLSALTFFTPFISLN